MARLPRLSVPGVVHYAILRARSGLEPFRSGRDCGKALDWMGEHARRLGIEWHAFVLLPQCAHLLLTPPERDSVSKLVQAFGRQFVPWFNRHSGSSGSPWDGRFRATVIDADHYLLDAMIALDLKPVREGLAARAADHVWSSHRHYMGLGVSPWLTPPPQYWALGNTPFAREAGYAARFSASVSEQQERQLEQAAMRGWALGDEAFIERIATMGARRPKPARVGRPRAPADPVRQAQ